MIKGFSGDRLEVNKKNGTITKYSDSKRIFKQAEKQTAFRRFNLSDIGFKIPEIKDGGTTSDGKEYYITMEYFPYMNMMDYLDIASPSDIMHIYTSLRKFIDFSLSSAKTKNVKKEIQNKYTNILSKVDFGYTLKDVSGIFYKLYNEFDGKVAVSRCHGDLTLSNILIDPYSRKMVLIDFLDSYIETPWMDIVKLRQDTKYLWSYFIYEDNLEKNDINKIRINLDVLDFFITSDYGSEHELLSFMNILRILPYVGNSEYCFLLNKLLKEYYHA